MIRNIFVTSTALLLTLSFGSPSAASFPATNQKESEFDYNFSTVLSSSASSAQNNATPAGADEPETCEDPDNGKFVCPP